MNSGNELSVEFNNFEYISFNSVALNGCKTVVATFVLDKMNSKHIRVAPTCRQHPNNAFPQLQLEHTITSFFTNIKHLASCVQVIPINYRNINDLIVTHHILPGIFTLTSFVTRLKPFLKFLQHTCGL